MPSTTKIQQLTSQEYEEFSIRLNTLLHSLSTNDNTADSLNIIIEKFMNQSDVHVNEYHILCYLYSQEAIQSSDSNNKEYETKYSSMLQSITNPNVLLRNNNNDTLLKNFLKSLDNDRAQVQLCKIILMKIIQIKIEPYKSNNWFSGIVKPVLLNIEKNRTSFSKIFQNKRIQKNVMLIDQFHHALLKVLIPASRHARR